MQNTNIPRLVGGTFFTQILLSKKPSGNSRDRTQGRTDSFRNEDVLFALLKIVDPEAFKQSTSFETYTSAFKNCKGDAGEDLEFKNSKVIEGFKERLKNDRPSVVDEMADFCKAYVDVRLNHSKHVLLVKRLIELILTDETLASAKFIVAKDGKPISINELNDVTAVHLPSFLLSIWEFVVLERKENAAGRDTIVAWDTTGNLGRFKGSKGSSIAQDIKVTFDRIASPKTNVGKEDCEMAEEPLTEQKIDNAVFVNYFDYLNGRYRKTKTLLYDETPMPFYDFYVCNHILSRFGHFWTENEEKLVPLLKHEYRDALDTLGFDKKSLNEPRRCNVSLRFLLRLYNFAIFTGTGGLGKSMLMRHLLLSAIDEIEEHDMLPVFVVLKDYSESGKSLYDHTFSVIGKYIDEQIFKAKLNDGKCLWLLDGLDEVKHSDRRKTKQEIDALTETYPKNYYYISSRPDERFVSYERYHVTPIQPFIKEQAIEMIKKLDFHDEKKKSDFLIELDKRLFDSHREFAENPLLLTIMLITYNRHTDVPSRMHIFYREAFDALAVRHDASKGQQRAFLTGLDKDEFQRHLSVISFRMYVDEKLSFTEEEFKEYYKKLNIDKRADDFLYDISHNLCIFLNEGRAYHFVHRSFQEYFAALHIKEMEEKYLERLADFFDKRYEKGRSDYTLFMLYDMKPRLVESFIFAPFLETLFGKCDAAENPYWEFLNQMYSAFYYTSGETNDADFPTEPNSNLYEFISRKFDFRHMIGFNDLPACDDFMDDTFYAIETVKGDWAILSSHECSMVYGDDGDVYITNHNADGNKEFIELVSDYKESVGYSYFVPVNDLFDESETYVELLNAINNDGFILKAEYYAAREYLASIRRREKETDDEYDSMFG